MLLRLRLTASQADFLVMFVFHVSLHVEHLSCQEVIHNKCDVTCSHTVACPALYHNLHALGIRLTGPIEGLLRNECQLQLDSSVRFMCSLECLLVP